MIHSISHRITLIIVSVSAFTIIAGATVFSYLMIKNTKDNYVQQGTMDLDLITEYLVLPLSFNNKERANEILSKVATKPYIEYCALLDAANNFFVDYQQETTKIRPIKQQYIGQEGMQFNQDILLIYKPVIYQGQYYGWILLQINTQLASIIKKHAVITLLIIFSVLLLSLLLTLGIQKTVSDPIITLSREMNKIATQEDFTHSIKKGEEQKEVREIQQLYAAFNSLTEKIADREARIEFIVNELKQNEAKFRTLTENSTDLVIRVNNDLSIDYANTASLHFLQKEKLSACQGAPLSSIEALDSSVVSLLTKHIAKAEISKKSEHSQIQIRNTPSSYYDFSFVPELSNEQEVISILCIGRDITTLKQTELHLLQAKIKAEESDRLKSAFLANMSHEIRTPMNAIIGFSQLIKDEKLNTQERDEFIGIIQQRGKDLMMIIDDIIDLSKIEAGEFNLSYDQFRIRTFMHEILLFYKKKINHEKKEQALSIIHHIDEHLPDMVYSAPSAIKQVLFNLISNAIKFTKQGGITVGVKEGNQKETLLFYVCDTGIGISEEHKNNIFNRFVQVEEYSTRQYGGTGLGLAICRGLIEQMKGDIWVDSEKEKGSTFYFQIPYHEQPKKHSEQALLR